MPGVRDAEGSLDVGVRLTAGHHHYRTAIQGLDPQGNLRPALDGELNPIPIPADGVLLTDEGTMTLAAVSLFVLSIAGLAIAAAVLVRLPPDYLKRDRAAYPRREASSWLRIILRNFLGVLLIAVGVVLSIPGVPGQGLVVGLAGLLLLDFPGKRSLICRLLSQQLLLRAVNRLRRRFSQPPLENG